MIDRIRKVVGDLRQAATGGMAINVALLEDAVDLIVDLATASKASPGTAEEEPVVWRAMLWGNAVYSTKPEDGKRWLANPEFECIPLYASPSPNDGEAKP